MAILRREGNALTLTIPASEAEREGLHEGGRIALVREARGGRTGHWRLIARITSGSRHPDLLAVPDEVA